MSKVNKDIGKKEKYYTKKLESDVFSNPKFKDHISETASMCNVDREVADFVVKQYLLTILFALSIPPKTYTRFVMPVAMFFKSHMTRDLRKPNIKKEKK